MTLSAADRVDLRDAARDFFKSHDGGEITRGQLEKPTDDDPGDLVRRLWQRGCRELGLGAICLPESLGGTGFDADARSLIAAECGRALYPGPVLSSAVLAGSMLAAVVATGGPAADKATELLDELGAGDLVLAAAVPAVTIDVPDGRHRISASDGSQVSGTSGIVIGGAAADAFLVAAVSPSGPQLLVVPRTAAGVKRQESIDGTRRTASVSFDAAPGVLLAAGDDADRIVGDAIAAGQLWVAAESVGVAERALADTVDYAKQRVQFGRPIGSFQAIAHRCAELLVAVETAKSAVVAAVSGADSELFRRSVSAAKSAATSLAREVTDEAIHIHGGIGFTWEHPMHLLHRRACANELLLGTPAEHRLAIYRSYAHSERHAG